jgi:peroxiredoxin
LAPVWGPDPGPEGILDEAIVAHINVRPRTMPAPEARTSSLICFANEHLQRPLSMLGEALLRSKHRSASVPIVLVLPRGSFAQKRSVVEERLGSFAQELRSPLLVTEDYEGSWTRAFDVTASEAMYLLSGEGELVWSHQSRLDAASLTAVLDERVKAGRRRRLRPFTLMVRAGAPAPEVLLNDGQRGGLTRDRLRGRRVVLLFWKACSRPCLAELGRLQRVQDRAGRQVPVIIGIGDGETSECIAEMAREHHLRLTLVADTNRTIARTYGVNCWPTMVSIDEEGMIDAVHSGVTHERSRLQVS